MQMGNSESIKVEDNNAVRIVWRWLMTKRCAVIDVPIRRPRLAQLGDSKKIE